MKDRKQVEDEPHPYEVESKGDNQKWSLQRWNVLNFCCAE